MSGRDRRRGGGGLFGKLAEGVGLAAEAIQHQRNKSKSPKPSGPFEPSNTGSPSVAAVRPNAPVDAYGQCSDEDLNQNEIFEREDGVTKHDEAIWDLDEAAAQVDTRSKAVIPKGVAKEPARISVLVDAFISAHQPSPPDDLAELPCSVIIPQRRPETRARGFVRAYSPYLEPSGISEDVFMQFLDFFDESLEFSNVIKVVKVAGEIVGLVPSAVCQAVSLGVAAGTKVAAGAHSNQRSNDFIARMNQQFFMPMGMVCLIMEFVPDQRTGDFNLESSINKATGDLHTNLKSSHGRSNEFEFPETAPLVFPALDKSEDKETLGKFARSKKFVADYQDRRAQAEFEAKNPGTVLASTMEGQTKFESGLADPRKYGNLLDMRGGLRSKISEYTGLAGGARGGPSRGQSAQAGGRAGLLGEGRLVGGRLAARREQRGARRGPAISASSEGQGQDSPVTVGRGRGRREGRGGLLGKTGIGPVGLISKVLKKDVLYMMIAPLPSNEELANATQSPDIQFVDVST